MTDMDDHGYVYILMNPSMKGLLKIGKSSRTGQHRADELSSSTGVPTPFIVVYESYFESCTEAEQFVHTYLETKGYRLSNNREFFEVSTKDAIDAVIEATKHYGEFSPIENDDSPSFDEEGVFSEEDDDEFMEDVDFISNPWDEAFETADKYYYGFDDEIVDYEEAMHYYLQAIKLGSVAESYLRVGQMYRRGEGVRVDQNKAFRFFKEGAKKGDPQCYIDMADMFSEKEDFENALKCWDKYWKESTDNGYLDAMEYISFVYLNDLKLKQVERLLPFKDKVIEFLEDYIRDSDDDFYKTSTQREIDFVKKHLDSTNLRDQKLDRSQSTDPNEESEERKPIWKNLFG